MGRLREVCGAVSGIFIVAGIKYGCFDPKDKISKDNHYELIQQLAKKFEDKHGSIVCRELLNIRAHHDNPISEKRTEEYYKKRTTCIDLVRSAVEIFEDVTQNLIKVKGD